MTEVEVATHGATEGKSVGDECGPPIDSHLRGKTTLQICFNDPSLTGVIYGSVSLLFATGTGNNDVCRQRSTAKGLAQRGFDFYGNQ